MNSVQTEFLNTYLKDLSEEQRALVENVSADYFCADEENANICSDLILRGEKRATCSMKYWYDVESEPLPKAGNLQVVTDWHGTPTSIIKITEVSECRFCDVTEEFAALEGEGDKSLAWWRKAHWDFFSTECKQANIEASDSMMLVLEQFEVVFPYSRGSG